MQPRPFIYLLSVTVFMLLELSSWTETVSFTKLNYILSGPSQKSLLTPASHHGKRRWYHSQTLPFFLLVFNTSNFMSYFTYYFITILFLLRCVWISNVSPFPQATLLLLLVPGLWLHVLISFWLSSVHFLPFLHLLLLLVHPRSSPPTSHFFFFFHFFTSFFSSVPPLWNWSTLLTSDSGLTSLLNTQNNLFLAPTQCCVELPL